MNKKILKIVAPIILLIIITIGAFCFNNRKNIGGRTFAGRLGDLSDVVVPSPSVDDFLKFNGTNWVNAATTPGAGTVTSVNVSVPTGLTVTGVPITSSGTAAITLTSGYIIPTTASTTNYDKAFATTTALGSMAFLPNTGSTTITTLGTITNFISTNATTTLLTVSGTSTIANQIISGSLSFSGSGMIMLPTSATLQTNMDGMIGVDTTSGQLRYTVNSATTTIVGFQASTVTIASTSWNTSGTTTIPLGVAVNTETWSSIVCYTDTATTTLNFGDGTNWMATTTATTTASTVALSSNNSFTATEKRYIRIYSFQGTPNYLSCTSKKSYDAD